MKKLKSENGVITLITLITVIFIISFLLSSYIIVANKVKTQKEILNETKNIYEPKYTMEEIYNSYFGNDNVVPVYTVEHLLAMGTGQQNVNINGNYYNFTNNEDTIYVLMNDLEFKASDYEEQLTNGYWVPVGNRILAFENLTDEELENEELLSSQFKAKFEGKNNDIEVIYLDEDSNEYSKKYSENKNYCETYKVGDYVNYTPDTGIYKVADGQYGSGATSVQSFTTETENSSLKWRILSIDESTSQIELVSDRAAQTLTLQGANGYNHGVDILNDLCNTLYSKTVNGKRVAEGRSINIKDIRVKTTYDYINHSNGKYKYGQIIALSELNEWDRFYPNLYEKEQGYASGGVKQEEGIDQSTGLNDGVINSQGITEYKTIIGCTNDYNAATNSNKKDVSITQLYYAYDTENYLKDLGRNTAPKGLIHIGESYFLASRLMNMSNETGNFGLFRVNETAGRLTSNNTILFNTWSNEIQGVSHIRPVVNLHSSVSLSLDLENSTDSVKYWNLDF